MIFTKESNNFYEMKKAVINDMKGFLTDITISTTQGENAFFTGIDKQGRKLLLKVEYDGYCNFLELHEYNTFFRSHPSNEWIAI